MRYESIADIYAANKTFRDELRSTLSQISDRDAMHEIEGEKWTLQQIVEHMAMVDNGISRICRKMLDASKQGGMPGTGHIELSPHFKTCLKMLSTRKAEAPERVQPTGNVTIAESLALMDSTEPAYAEMQADLESFAQEGETFPHPYFGDLNSWEWLIVKGLHESRHTAQLQRLIDKLQTQKAPV